MELTEEQINQLGRNFVQDLLHDWREQMPKPPKMQERSVGLLSSVGKVGKKTLNGYCIKDVNVGNATPTPPKATPAIAGQKQSFTGEKKDKLGHRRCYTEGILTPCPTKESQPSEEEIADETEEQEKDRTERNYGEVIDFLEAVNKEGTNNEGVHKLRELLGGLTVEQLQAIKDKYGIGSKLKFKKGKPKTEEELTEQPKEETSGEAEPEQPSDGGGGQTTNEQTPEPSRPVAPEVAGPTTEEGGRSGEATSEPTGEQPPERIPADIQEVNQRLDRYANFFRSKGQHEVAGWMDQLKDHINNVGTEEALEALGKEVRGEGESVQYGGVSEDIPQFAGAYLERYGITPLVMGTKPKKAGDRVVASVAPSKEGIASRGKEGDVYPSLQGLRDKLHEAQNLPGLESSEDLSKLMGGEFGAPVNNFTPELLTKLDEKYGKGQWIVKSYGDEAYAGYGIFFPQRVEQLKKDAQNAIWTSGQELAKYGFKHLRDEEGNIVGIQHEGGDKYKFGSKKYEDAIEGEARKWADEAWDYADSEKTTAIPEGKFMAQPAFSVVGISNEERAQGVTFKKGQEGRVHITTKNGKAEIVPHSTWLKNEFLPVVFESDDTRAMAQAAVDAINALPEAERKGQLYAPDIVRTADGFKVVEANPANEAGASGYLADNPLIIDGYVSHLVGREPAHVRFIRKLLSKRPKRRKEEKSLLRANYHFAFYSTKAIERKEQILTNNQKKNDLIEDILYHMFGEQARGIT